MSPTLTVDRLDVLLIPRKTEEVDLPTLLQALYQRGYTGPLTLHFQGGMPRVVEFEAPQLRLSS